jgi:hypothetical protein
MAAEVAYRKFFLEVLRRFPGMGAADSRSLRYDRYVSMRHFVRRSTFVSFRRFGGDVRRKLLQRLLLLFMVLWVPTFAMLCKRAVLMLWHVSLLRGLKPVGFFPPRFPLLIAGFHSLQGNIVQVL